MSRLDWEQYDDKGYNFELVGENFNLGYNWQDTSWQLNFDGDFSIESDKDDYSPEQAKAWAEEEISKYLQKKLKNLESAIRVLT
jgi:hypothetical protein